MYHIKEAAELSGVSVKTLHHYDKIGLLVPVKSENGYRTYSQEDLERLQVILYYKYLGFSLDQIAELLAEEKSNLLPHLTRQLDYLTRERQHLDTLIATLQKTIQEQKGERNMTIEEKFTGFSYQDNQKYHQEEAAKLLDAIRTYGFDCSIEVFGHIGKGYVYNPEFKENIDKFGAGTAQYTSNIIAFYVENQAK